MELRGGSPYPPDYTTRERARACVYRAGGACCPRRHDITKSARHDPPHYCPPALNQAPGGGGKLGGRAEAERHLDEWPMMPWQLQIDTDMQLFAKGNMSAVNCK